MGTGILPAVGLFPFRFGRGLRPFRNVLVLSLLFTLAGSLTSTSPPCGQDGRASPKTNCAGCHGREGQGQVGPGAERDQPDRRAGPPVCQPRAITRESRRTRRL